MILPSSSDFRAMRRLGAYRSLQIYSLVQFVSLIICGLGRNYPVVLLGAGILGVILFGRRSY